MRLLIGWIVFLLPRIALAGEQSSDEMPILALIILPFVFVLLFSLIWCGAIGVTSFWGGWNRLAQRYRSEAKRPANLLRTSAVFRYFVNYSQVLNLGSTKEGMHLSVMKIFSIAHPDLLIPWDDITERKNFKWLFLSFKSIEVDTVTIWLYSSAWKKIIEERQ